MSDTPFDRETTAAEVVADLDLTGRRVVVTGGASGIGGSADRLWELSEQLLAA